MSAADRALYLIDPYAPAELGLALEAMRGIVAGERTADAAVIGPQRYLVKEPWRGEAGYRAALELRVAERLGLAGGRRRALAVTSGTTALRLAARAVLPPPRGDRREVLMPAVTVANTAEALVAAGYTPVLVDVDPETWLIDLASAARARSPRTVGLVSVDWLGTSVDLGAVEGFCRAHELPWISDSAQSFGVLRDGTGPGPRADATIYSTGYPKVFHTGGRGGILVVAPAAAAALERDPAGALRNEPLAELACLLGLALLADFDRQLAARRRLGARYRELLAGVPGLQLPRLDDPSHSNAYQLSARVDASRAGASAAELAAHLEDLGVQASAERVPSLAEHARLREVCATPVPLPAASALARASITLPMPRDLDEAHVAWICRALATRARSAAVLVREPAAGSGDAGAAEALVHGIGGSRYWSIEEEPLVYFDADGARRVARRVLAPPRVLHAAGLSVSAALAALAARAAAGPLAVGAAIVGPLAVRAIVAAGDLVLDERSPSDEIAPCPESGSSARVALCLGAAGELSVRKRCAHDGIDGNGRPWLARQYDYARSPELAPLADVLVRPTELAVTGAETVISVPYFDGGSLAEHVLGGGDPDLTRELLGEVCAALARRAWTACTVAAPGRYLADAHLGRMRRRLAIAAGRHAGLAHALALDELELDGERLLGLPAVCDRLTAAGVWARLEPRRLGLIHGDLNLYNVLCARSPGAAPRVRLIDPRGTPLWSAGAAGAGPERGDYVYDLAKLGFSFGGFVAIRAGLLALAPRAAGTSAFALVEAGDPIARAALARGRADFAALCASDPAIAEARAELGEGLEAMLARLELAEAANFVADAACALGRDRADEVLPLFLVGLRQLNRACARWGVGARRAASLRGGRAASAPPLGAVAEDRGGAAGGEHGAPRALDRGADPARAVAAAVPGAVAPTAGDGVGADSAPAALAAIRAGLWGAAIAPPWDVIEVIVRRRAVGLAARCLARARGRQLPRGAEIAIAHHPDRARGAAEPGAPLVIVHGVDDGAPPLVALREAIARTDAYLAMGDRARRGIAGGRVLTVLPAPGSSAGPLVRCGEPLLAVGPADTPPLLLLLAAAYPLAGGPRGRWVLDGDALLLAAPPLGVAADRLALLPGAAGGAWAFVPHALASALRDAALPALAAAGGLAGLEALVAAGGLAGAGAPPLRLAAPPASAAATVGTAEGYAAVLASDAAPWRALRDLPAVLARRAQGPAPASRARAAGALR